MRPKGFQPLSARRTESAQPRLSCFLTSNQPTLHGQAYDVPMKAVALILTLIALTFSLVSCGGNGSSAPSPFQGTFAGNWTSDGPDSGTAQVTVTPGGHTTGTEDNTTESVTGSVDGHLHNNGTFSGTVTPQGGSAVTATGTFTISQDGNTLSGTVLFGGVTYTYTLTRTI
jgi:hypothetical protein